MPADTARRADKDDLPGGSADWDEQSAQRRHNLLNTELLNAELPDQRFVDETYLHWLYDLNPYGPAFQAWEDEDGVRVAHYALIPQRYRNPEGQVPFVFSLNAVSRSGSQRKGYFGMLQLRVWSAARDAGIQAGIGVTNARSHRGVQIMGWRMIGQMPVNIVLPGPFPARGWQSFRVTPDFLASPTFKELSEGLDEQPVEHWTNSWTSDYLRWRLASPNTPPYVLHADDKVVAISTRSQFKGVPVAVILKLLLRRGWSGPVSGHPAATEICRFHRAPAAVYAGFNRHVKITGVPAPERLKPSPLNLELCSLSDAILQRDFVLDTYEFLDMDAY
jgi:hypothetical protein